MECEYTPKEFDFVVCGMEDIDLDKCVGIFREYKPHQSMPLVSLWAIRWLGDYPNGETECAGSEEISPILNPYDIGVPYTKVRPATEKEKSYLLEGIESLGLVWDFDKKIFLVN